MYDKYKCSNYYNVICIIIQSKELVTNAKINKYFYTCSVKMYLININKNINFISEGKKW